MFSFYPHTCLIEREDGIDENTGDVSKVEIFSGECNLSEGTKTFKDQILQGDQKLHISDATIIFKIGDLVTITFDNGGIRNGKVKQFYPITDEDFGGQEISLSNIDE